MSVDRPDNERRLVPRWRSSSDAIIAGELKPLTRLKASLPTGVPTPEFDALLQQWAVERNLDTATDILACGVSLGRIETPQVQQAARFLVDRNVDLEVISIAKRVLSGRSGVPNPTNPISFDPDLARVQIRAEINRLKFRVRQYPKNAVAWIDLARLYVAIGQTAKAEQAIRVAISLAPDSRFIVRSAARFYVHAHHEANDDAIDSGLKVLRKSALLRVDPWVMAAEISLATISGGSPKSYKSAKVISESDGFSPWDSSELNGALATLALGDGGLGKPKKLFTKSLRMPTENALAQAQWASSRHGGIFISDKAFSDAGASAYEAMAIRYRSEEKWEQVVAACKSWSTMEPTSTRPLALGGFVAEVALEDGVSAKEFFLRAQVLAPNDSWANNNLAVALAYCGELDEAEFYLDKNDHQHLTDRAYAVHLATRGLIAYRRGDPLRGRQLYMQASELSVSHGDRWVTAMSAWHLLREESKYSTDGVVGLADELWKRTVPLRVPELKAMRDGIRSYKPDLVRRLSEGFSRLQGKDPHKLISPAEITRPFDGENTQGE